MTVWITGASSLFVVVVGALLAYLNAQRLSQRQARLARLNAQLEELYGPMFALNSASREAWEVFRSEYRPSGSFFGDGPPPTTEEVGAWVIWMRTVFMPVNRSIYQLILSKTHLLEGEEMPDELLNFAAHVLGYEVTIAKWDTDDYTDLTSLINHPSGVLDDYAQNSFNDLKRRQQLLLGHKTLSQRHSV